VVLAFCFNSSAGAVTILYGQGHGLDVTRLSTYGGHSLGGTFTQSDSGWASALGGGLGAYDAIVLSHPAGPSTLSAATIAAIGTYVSGGGRLIIGGDHGFDFITLSNAVFGYSVTFGGLGAGGASPISKTAAAAGTSFASAPSTVFDISATDSLISAPGVVMYTGLGGDVVSMDTYGSGIIGFFGWDFCCGDAAKMDDWYRVLDSSLTYSPVIIPEPSTALLLGMGLVAMSASRRLRGF